MATDRLVEGEFSVGNFNVIPDCCSGRSGGTLGERTRGNPDVSGN